MNGISGFIKKLYSLRIYTQFKPKEKVFPHKRLWCTAMLDKFCAIYLILTKEMKWHLWQELLKLTYQIWKPSYDLMQVTIWKYTWTFDKFWQKSYLSF